MSAVQDTKQKLYEALELRADPVTNADTILIQLTINLARVSDELETLNDIMKKIYLIEKTLKRRN